MLRCSIALVRHPNYHGGEVGLVGVEASLPDSIITINSGNTSAGVHKFGATIVSWKVDGRERLFVSSKAIWDGSKPIRGACLAQFGTDPIMAGQHGFARGQVWQVEKTANDTIICSLRDNQTTRAAWPYSFSLTYKIKVEEGRLQTTFIVENPSNAEKTFKFTALLHTYFAVGDIGSVHVMGFNGLSFQDKLLNGQLAKEERDKVTVQEEVDRTYLSTPNKILLHSEHGVIEIQKDGWADVVFWNPWIEKSKAMADFDDEEYKQMVCIEAGQVVEPVELRPGSTWSASQVLVADQ